MTMAIRLIDASYFSKKEHSPLLDHLQADFTAGKTHLIFGDSAFERSALSALLAGREPLTSWLLLYEGDMRFKADGQTLQADEIGTVFQTYNYIPDFSAVDNLHYHLQMIGRSWRKSACLSYLEEHGIDRNEARIPLKKAENFIQKKYCLAKSVVTKPAILLLDGLLNGLPLDRQEQVMHYLNTLAHTQNTCVIILEGESVSGKYVDEVWGISRGRLSFIKQK